MEHTTTSRFVEGMAFDADIDGHTIRFDDKTGNSGPRPKAILLNALAICTGFDLVSILQKMKLSFTNLSITSKGQLTNDVPQVYDHIHLDFFLKYDDLDQNKVERAIELSLKKYCGVYAMLIKVCPITHSLHNLKD